MQLGHSAIPEKGESRDCSLDRKSFRSCNLNVSHKLASKCAGFANRYYGAGLSAKPDAPDQALTFW